MISLTELVKAGPDTVFGRVADGAGASVVVVEVVDVLLVDELDVVELSVVELSVDVLDVELDVEVVVDVLDESPVDVVAVDDDDVGAFELVEVASDALAESTVVDEATSCCGAVCASGFAGEAHPAQIKARSMRTVVLRLLANGCGGGASAARRCDAVRIELDDLLVKLVDDAAQRQDVQHALTVLEEVNNLFAAANQGRLSSVDYQVGCRNVFTELILKVRKNFTNLFKANA